MSAINSEKVKEKCKLRNNLMAQRQHYMVDVTASPDQSATCFQTCVCGLVLWWWNMIPFTICQFWPFFSNYFVSDWE